MPRKFTYAILLSGLITLFLPYFFYFYGLQQIQEFPEPCFKSLDTVSSQNIWQIYYGQGNPNLVKISPYNYVFAFLCNTQASTEEQIKKCNSKYPGLAHANIFAGFYLRNSKKIQKPLTLGISEAALAIWLTNHWSIDEILNGIYYYREYFYKKHNKR